MRPMLLMHYSAAELEKLKDDDELLDDLVNRFNLEIAWNRLTQNSIAAGGMGPWLLDVSVVGEPAGIRQRLYAAASGAPALQGEIAEEIRLHFPKMTDMVRNEIIGYARHGRI